MTGFSLLAQEITFYFTSFHPCLCSPHRGLPGLHPGLRLSGLRPGLRLSGLRPGLCLPGLRPGLLRPGHHRDPRILPGRRRHDHHGCPGLVHHRLLGRRPC